MFNIRLVIHNLSLFSTGSPLLVLGTVQRQSEREFGVCWENGIPWLRGIQREHVGHLLTAEWILEGVTPGNGALDSTGSSRDMAKEEHSLGSTMARIREEATTAEDRRRHTPLQTADIRLPPMLIHVTHAKEHHSTPHRRTRV